jgi:hypothetical protein
MATAPSTLTPDCCAHKDFQIWAAYGKCGLRLLFRASVVGSVNPHCCWNSGPRSIGAYLLSKVTFEPSVSTVAAPLSNRRMPKPPSSPPVPLASALVWKPMK